jgi:hypothetical protein
LDGFIWERGEKEKGERDSNYKKECRRKVTRKIKETHP